MTPDLYRVQNHGRGFVAVMPRPRAGDWLEDEMRGLQRLGVTLIASLLEPAEAHELGLQEEESVARRHGLGFCQFPIPDRSTPANQAAYAAFIAELASAVGAGAGLAIHCRAGIGRSGLTAAATLVALGEDPATVFDRISEARGVQVPDTDEQRLWFEHYWREVVGR